MQIFFTSFNLKIISILNQEFNSSQVGAFCQHIHYLGRRAKVTRSISLLHVCPQYLHVQSHLLLLLFGLRLHRMCLNDMLHLWGLSIVEVTM